MVAPRVDGCWTCKSRKKRCDGRKPTCRECERLNRICKGYAKRIIWEDAPVRAGMSRRGFGTSHPRGQARNSKKPHSAALVSATSGALMPWSRQDGLSSTEVLLLDWYIGQFATSYPRYNKNPSYPSYSANQNPFLFVLLPMAFESPFLLRAVLALAGTQACLRQPALKTTTLQCRSAALRSLRESVVGSEVQTKDARNNMMSLACAMSLFLYEKIECSNENALRGHLSYAGVLIRSIIENTNTHDDTTRWLFYLFAHNDIYTSIAFRQPLIMDSLFDIPLQFLDSNTFLGILASIFRLSFINSWIEKKEAGERLLNRIEHWQPSVSWLHSAEQTHTRAIDSAGEAYKTAAYVSLSHILGNTPCQDRIRDAVEIILSIDSSDPIRPSLLWPAVVIGAEASDILQRVRLQEHLLYLAEDSGFRQYARAVKLLNDCWEARDMGMEDSWVEIMHHSGEIILCAL